MTINNLTNKQYWDNNWKSKTLPQQILIKNAPNSIKELHRTFTKYLPFATSSNSSILEVGCAPGAWLDYFYKNFNYRLYGIDYSSTGYQNTLENLKLLQTPATIYYADFLKHSFNQSFDVVFSLGFIEHFQDPSAIIEKKIKLLKTGGFLILEIPNLTHLNKLFVPTDILLSHNLSIMNLAYFESIVTKYKLKKIFLNYVGAFNPYLFPNHNNRFNYYKNILLASFSNIVKHPSSWYSPYILLIAQK